ncbi:MAG: type II secretion system GspH family protein [Actinomycetota bacterium]|nr:type II secretion system GspH family protein [Actinomycetota bacterium]
MKLRIRSDRGLSLVETLVAITIFALITIGIVPLLGTAMRGGAATRTESVGRNLASKTLERLRGLQYHVAYSSTPRKADLLDHFFPGRTPAYAPPTTKTGFDSGSNSFVTSCDKDSTAAACKTLPTSSEIPDGYSVEIRLTFKDVAAPTTTVPVPSTYAWNAAGDQDAPPSELIEVGVTSAWTVGAKQQTFNLTSYLSNRTRGVLPDGSGAPPPPPPGGLPTQPPPNVKLRAEARIDYGIEVTTTYQDTQTPPRFSELTATLGNAVAYGEQLDSGSRADLTARAGEIRMVRPANPAVPSDTGVDVSVNGATLAAHAPPDAGSIPAPTTAVAGTATHPEITGHTGGMGFLGPSEAGLLAGPRGAGPTVAGGLPFVKGYYDLNATSGVAPAFSNQATHLWIMPQGPASSTARGGTLTTINPLDYKNTLNNSSKMITVNDYQNSSSPAWNVDPRGEVEIDSTDVSNPSTRVVHAAATLPAQSHVFLYQSFTQTTGGAALQIRDLRASVECDAKADPSQPSTATGSWRLDMSYWNDPTNNGSSSGSTQYQVTLPVQTRTDNPQVPEGDTNPLQTIRNLNGGNGPLFHDASDNRYDVYLIAANGKRGILKDWSAGTVETSISSDDRVASAQLNGAFRMETSPFHGPWDDGTQTSQKPRSDYTLAFGKLSCKAEDYR